MKKINFKFAFILISFASLFYSLNSFADNYWEGWPVSIIHSGNLPQGAYLEATSQQVTMHHSNRVPPDAYGVVNTLNSGFPASKPTPLQLYTALGRSDDWWIYNIDYFGDDPASEVSATSVVTIVNSANTADKCTITFTINGPFNFDKPSQPSTSGNCSVMGYDPNDHMIEIGMN